MLRQLMLEKKLATAKEELRVHLEKGVQLRERRDAWTKREKEIETAVDEITNDSTEDERNAVDDAIASHEQEGETLVKDETEFENEKVRLNDCVTKIENELSEISERTRTAGNSKPESNKTSERKVENKMENRTKFFGLTIEQRDSFMAREDVKKFLTETRDYFSATRGNTRALQGGQVVVPTIMLDLIRDNIEKYSKLLKYVRMRKVNGKARQPIVGEVPEAVWTEAVGYLNELDMSLNAIEVDAFMLGGYIAIPNTTLEDGDDVQLASAIMEAMGEAIGKGIDRAIPYGTGVKMPLGFITRLAQKAKPADYPTDAPEWKDLSTSNVLTLNIADSKGTAFFTSLIEALGAAKPKNASTDPFWIMTRKTHLDIMAKALAFNASAALVAGVNSTMPIIGGDIIEMDDSIIPDYQIGGGYGEKYLLAERDGAAIGHSEHARYVENQTVFKATGRYDGEPIFAESFVVVSYNNVAPTTTSTFAEDKANSSAAE